MHLFSKSQIIARKNDEERVAATQGMELATRVDGLRKQNLEEEKKLTINRQLMLGIIAEELETARLEKEAIKTEVEQLKEARIRLQEPLTAEWDALHEEQANWHEKLVEMEMWKEMAKLKDQRLSEQMDIVNDNLQSSLKLKKDASELMEKSEIRDKEINRLSKQLSRDIEAFAQKRDLETANLKERETRLNRKEEEIKNKEANVNLRERELSLKKLRGN